MEERALRSEVRRGKRKENFLFGNPHNAHLIGVLCEDDMHLLRALYRGRGRKQRRREREGMREEPYLLDRAHEVWRDEGLELLERERTRGILIVTPYELDDRLHWLTKKRVRGGGEEKEEEGG